MRIEIASAAVLVLLATSLTVVPVLAAPPVVGNDQTSTLEDTPVTIDLLRNDSDPDGDPLSILSVADPPSGSTKPGSTPGSIIYTPDRNFNGDDRWLYTVTDTHGETATGLIMVFVNGVNDPPIAANRTSTVAEDGSVEVLFVGMDPDKERCDLIFQVEQITAFGRVGPLSDAGCSPNGDFAKAIYTPLPGYNGPDRITYSVNDGTVSSSFGLISITVTPVEDPPIALAGSATTTAPTPVAISLRGSDWETCELTFAATTPARGTLSGPLGQPCGAGGPVDPNVDTATVTYTPSPGFSGTDTFSFTVSDGVTTSVPATVTVQVNAPPTVHAGDLDGSALKMQKVWTASVTVAAHDQVHAVVSGATVQGAWSSGGTGSCITSASGRCTLTSPQQARKTASVTFTVTTVAATGRTYDAGVNHDPDGDSTGTTIVVARP